MHMNEPFPKVHNILVITPKKVVYDLPTGPPAFIFSESLAKVNKCKNGESFVPKICSVDMCAGSRGHYLAQTMVQLTCM